VVQAVDAWLRKLWPLLLLLLLDAARTIARWPIRMGMGGQLLV
jgi:hypothetical protein